MAHSNDTSSTQFSISDYLLWEKQNFYSQTFPLSAQYALVGVDSLIASQVVYGLIVLWGLSRKRADKKPLITEGRWALRVYNVIQVALSGYIAYLATSTYLKKVINQGHICQPMKVIIESDPEEYELETYTTWLFYISKWVDYMDTLFIIARSKWRQLSFLHTFHHCTMIAITWLAIHYYPCGLFLIAPQLNAPVHFVMYFYYLLSSFPSLTPFLWWKNYITSIQLLQFVTGIVLTVTCLSRQAMGYLTGLCFSFLAMFSIYGFILIALFSSFYIKTYNTPTKAQASSAESYSSSDGKTQRKSKKEM